MRTYLQLFFTLLVPLNILCILVLVIYFKQNYNFTQSMRVGVLYGFFIASAFSFILALLLLIFRSSQKNHHQTNRETKASHSKAVASKEKTETVKTSNTKSQKERPSKLKNEEKVMLLMDKELAYEIALYAIIDQNIGKIKLQDLNQGSISVNTSNDTIEITVNGLTKHTSEVNIKTDKHSENIDKIITYIKTRENSFLQY